MKKRGVPYAYEATAFEYSYRYIPDFFISGGIYLEAKGVLDDETIRKMRAVKAQNPSADIRIVFMKPNNRIKGSRMTYGQWADKNGFPWCGPDIPQEWIEQL